MDQEHRSGQLVTVFVWGVAIYLALHFFEPFKIIFLGFLAAGCVACAMRPLVPLRKGNRTLRSVLAGLLPPVVVIALLVLAVWQLVQPVRDHLGQLPQMEQQLNAALAKISEWIGLQKPMHLREVLDQGGQYLSKSGGKLFTTVSGVMAGVGLAFALVVIGSIFLLKEKPGTLVSPILQLLPAKRQGQFEGAIAVLEPRLRMWLLATLLGATIIGVASWLAFVAIGLQFAFPLALLAGVGELVPTIGPLIAFVVAVIFAAGQGTTQVIGVTIAYVLIQFLESNVIIPLVMKKAVRIPEIVTLFSLVFWGMIFGLPGLLLANAINLVIWSFVEQFLIVPRRN